MCCNLYSKNVASNRHTYYSEHMLYVSTMCVSLIFVREVAQFARLIKMRTIVVSLRVNQYE